MNSIPHWMSTEVISLFVGITQDAAVTTSLSPFCAYERNLYLEAELLS